VACTVTDPSFSKCEAVWAISVRDDRHEHVRCYETSVANCVAWPVQERTQTQGTGPRSGDYNFRTEYCTGCLCKEMYQAFLKKLAILPCPFFAAGFIFELLDCLMGTGLSFLGCGSSSEKDSHAASSLVTGAVSLLKRVHGVSAYLSSHPHP
jgi:hypothetical protein